MGKDKIRKFKENETFKCLIQPRMDEVIGKEHPLKGNWDKEVFHNGNPWRNGSRTKTTSA